MARLPRLTLPGYPHHVIQRGNNRQPIFNSAADYQYMLELLQGNAARLEVAVHAYVLMGNHFHLLATPRTERDLAQLMQSVGRSYVRYFNARYGRSGTLWEGRYRSTLLEAERYLVPGMVYMDLNPVRSGLVSGAAEYPWSSHGYYAGLRRDTLVTPHEAFWALGNTPFAREAAYVETVHAGIDTAAQMALTQAVLGGWAMGSPEFLAGLQKLTPRRLGKARAGRPPAVDTPSDD